jgi:hypothetical protein
MKLKKGDRVIFGKSAGTIMEEPEFVATPSHGLWWSKIRWDDGKTSQFCLNRIGLKKLD